VQDLDGMALRGQVATVLAATPCTVFANSGARWKWTKHRTPFLMRQGYMTAWHCARIIGETEPRVWAIENPIGSLPRYIGPYDWSFQPNEYGDPYTKRTCIWSNVPKPPTAMTTVEATEGSKLWRLGPGPERQALRSATPAGFAQAFFAGALAAVQEPLL
jgi:hypothetical protein